MGQVLKKNMSLQGYRLCLMLAGNTMEIFSDWLHWGRPAKGFAPLRRTCAVKVLRGCGCCVLMGRISLTVCFFVRTVCLCTSLVWSDCGKHLTGSLVSHFLAAAWMKVESFTQALFSCTQILRIVTPISTIIPPGPAIHCYKLSEPQLAAMPGTEQMKIPTRRCLLL